MSVPQTLAPAAIPVEKADLYKPSLEEIASVLNNRLKKNFKEVKVQLVECPDLTQKPFTLACKGLGGSPTVVEVGGVPYLLPMVQKEKLYDLKDIAKLLKLESVYMTGAGAGPWPFAKTNCEMIMNIGLLGSQVKNETRIGTVDMSNGKCVQDNLPDSETRFALLANIFASKGEPGKVIEISCKVRTGKDDFITAVRTSLQDHYGSKPIGLGGVFMVSQGKVKQHVMPDFSTTPLNSEEELNNWLKFYNMDTPLIALGTLVSADPGLDLRVQHFHSFSHHGEAGHYHIDTTPDTVQYLAYFNVADEIYRLDRPKITHSMGRD